MVAASVASGQGAAAAKVLSREESGPQEESDREEAPASSIPPDEKDEKDEPATEPPEPEPHPATPAEEPGKAEELCTDLVPRRSTRSELPGTNESNPATASALPAEQRTPTPPRMEPTPPSVPCNSRGSGRRSSGEAVVSKPESQEPQVNEKEEPQGTDKEGAPPRRQSSQKLFSRTWNRTLGTDHKEAVGYMADTKGEMEVIMETVNEIYNEQATDALECCFSDVKRIVAVRAGEDVFDQIDINKDGKLSVDEVNQYFARNPALREQLSSLNADQFKSDWLQMLDMLDEDGNHSVDMQEFTDFWTSNGLGDYGDACRLFQKMDASDDGQLSTAEVKRYLKKDDDLAEKLAEARCRKLLKEWEAFFDMMKDGTEGECDKAQFASLWAASGLGLKMARRAEKADTDPALPQGKPSSDSKRLLIAQQQPVRAKSPLQPRPPSTSRSRGPRPLHSYEAADPDTYLIHPTACLERPCVAKKVNYHDILAGQQTALCERNASLESYNEMLRKMEEYQAVALRVLDAHYNALTHCSQIRSGGDAELPSELPPHAAHMKAVECT